MRTAAAFVLGISFGALALAGDVSCSQPQTPATVANEALTVGQIVCIASSALTSSTDLEKVCNIVDSPAIRSLIDALTGQREAAKRVGFDFRRAHGDTDQ